jgi:mannosyltransferase OCH1-like enzyme
MWIVSFTSQPLYPWERGSGTHWIGGWVGPRTGLDTVSKRKVPTGIEPSNPDHPARIQSLYRLPTLIYQDMISLIVFPSEVHVCLWVLWCGNVVTFYLRICVPLPHKGVYTFSDWNKDILINRTVTYASRSIGTSWISESSAGVQNDHR